MSKQFIFSSESVGEGHPDKVCDTISDAVLDACLTRDKFSRVACECYAKSNVVIVGGEITIPSIGYRNPSDVIDFVGVARKAIADIGYTHDDDVFPRRQGVCERHHHRPVPRHCAGRGCAQGQGQEDRRAGRRRPGVDVRIRLRRNPGTDARADHVRAPAGTRAHAHPQDRQGAVAAAGRQVPGLRDYENDNPVAIFNVVISTQHAADVDHREIENFFFENVIRKVLPARLLTRGPNSSSTRPGVCHRRPAGRHRVTGRKIIVDSYGGMGRHGGGAFSGKDPTKVDRSAAYMGRWVAKNIVAAGLASKCEIQFAYAIGHPDPVSIHVDTFGTASVPESRIVRAVNRVFSFQPADIIDQLNLRRPIYSKTTNYGHFGKNDPALTWEKTDKISELKKAI